MKTDTHTDTEIHTGVHMLRHTCTHTLSLTHTCMHPPSHSDTQWHTNTHTHTHSLTCTHLHTYQVTSAINKVKKRKRMLISDGRNHENCCARSEVPTDCLLLCSNDQEKMSQLSDLEMHCLNHTESIISCYEFGGGKCCNCFAGKPPCIGVFLWIVVLPCTVPSQSTLQSGAPSGACTAEVP